MPKGRRWIVAAVTVTVLVFWIVVAIIPNRSFDSVGRRQRAQVDHGINLESYNAIREGMTEEEVDAILRVPAGVYTDSSTYYYTISLPSCGLRSKMSVKRCIGEYTHRGKNWYVRNWYGDWAFVSVYFTSAHRVRNAFFNVAHKRSSNLELEKLQGVWMSVGANASSLLPAVFTIEDDRFWVNCDDDPRSATIRVNPEKSPMQIDLVRWKYRAVSIQRGIYKWNGKDLHIALGLDGKRPKRFDTERLTIYRWCWQPRTWP